VPTCAEVGVFGILPGVIGLIQATEALKLILGIGEPLIGRFIIYDALSMTIDEFKIKKNPACPVCSEHPTIDHLIDYDQFCGFPNRSDGRSAAPAEWEISAIDLSARLKDPCAAGVRLVDVREKHEWQFARLPSAESIPLDDLRCRLAELHPDEEIVLYCQKDWRAIAAMEILLANNYHRVSVLRGGLKAWAKEVDPSLPDYW
jgi:adenylyltransferase/sulfurtransferase